MTDVLWLKIRWAEVRLCCVRGWVNSVVQDITFFCFTTWLELCINLTLGLLQTEHLTKWQPVESDIDWVWMFSLQFWPTDIVPTHAAKSQLFS